MTLFSTTKLLLSIHLLKVTYCINNSFIKIRMISQTVLIKLRMLLCYQIFTRNLINYQYLWKTSSKILMVT